MTALCHPNRLGRGICAAGRSALAAALLLLGACASSGNGPGAPWLLWATLRSLAGMPPTPPDFYSEPVRVSDTLKFTAITAGGDHTCALTVDGETYCWGSNRYDELGDGGAAEICGNGPGAYSCSSTPVRVRAAPRFTSLAAMRRGTCGLAESGAVHCWGYGFGGRTDAGMPASGGVPVEVPGGHLFVALASSASSAGRACGLTREGRVWCWGLSDGADGGASGVFDGPALVPAGPTFVSISFGGQHGCGLDNARNAWCWGNNEYGALGAGPSGHEGGIRDSAAPVPVQDGLAFNQVVAGGGHSCGWTVEGAAYCWGLGYPADGDAPAYPRLSREPLPHGAQPVPIEHNDSSWSTLGTGDLQTCGLTEDGGVYCFSALPVRGPNRRPGRIQSDRTFVELAVGNRHACAIGADALAYCWGDGSSGQVGRPPSGRNW